MTADNNPEQLRAAIQTLENIVANRALMAGLSADERVRLLRAAGEVLTPDSTQKRRFTRARIRKHKQDRIQKEQAVLNRAGIRELRRRPVYTTPDPLPAP